MSEENTSKPLSEEEKLLAEYEWIIRPCQMYNDEYRECTSIKGRFHQYFIFGETVDCSQWRRDTDNCEKWKEKNDLKAAKEIINSELVRRRARLNAHFSNNVWQRRDKPPEDWDKPLPERISKNYDNSYLGIKARRMRGEDVPHNPIEDQKICNIM